MLSPSSRPRGAKLVGQPRLGSQKLERKIIALSEQYLVIATAGVTALKRAKAARDAGACSSAFVASGFRFSGRLWAEPNQDPVYLAHVMREHGKGGVILVNDQRSATLSDKPDALKRRGSQHPDLR
jgi:hypothetical protein